MRVLIFLIFGPVVTPILHDMLLYDMRSIFGFDQNDYGVNKKGESEKSINIPRTHMQTPSKY